MPPTSTCPSPSSSALIGVEALPADRRPPAVYLAGLAPGSRRSITRALEVVARTLTGGRAGAGELAWHAVRFQHTAALRAALAARYAPATANHMLAALRGALGAAWRLGQMSAEEYHRAVDLPAVRGERLPRGRALTQGELRALFGECAKDRRPAGARDAAVFAVLYGGGLRRSEVVALDLADFDPETSALTIRHGKGGRQRVVYANNGSETALQAWLAVRGQEPGALLCPVSKSGRVEPRRMTDHAVLLIVRRRAEDAGVARFSPHDLRRSFVSDLLDAGADLAVVQRLAGHASPSTTSRYDRRPEEAMRRASGMLHVPYRAPATDGASA